MTPEPTLLALAPGDLAPHAPGLRRLERGLSYPIADGADTFTIDHGERYHPFFAGLGRARFVVARAGDEVVGSLAFVERTARQGSRTLRTVYFADYKVAPEARGTGLARRLGTRAAWEIARSGLLARLDRAYLAAMRGARGDVTRTARGVSFLTLFRPLARLALYFEAPGKLAPLEGGPKPPESEGLDLSPHAPDEPLATTGRKDFVLASTGKPWPLVHLPASPARRAPALGAWLARHARTLLARGGESLACFGVDERLEAHVSFLAAHGISPGATCTIHSVNLRPWRRSPEWVHLATSEI